MIGQEVLVLCMVSVPNANIISPGLDSNNTQSFINPFVFNVTLPRKIVSFFSYDS
jgi:hypothetical protein